MSKPDNSPFTIRTATDDDYAQVAEIYNQYIVGGNTTMDTELKDAEYYAKTVANFTDRERLLVADDGEEVIGWGVIKSYSDRPGYAVACETAIYLRSGKTGMGLGSRLKKYVIQLCQELGYHHLVAKIFSENKASINYNLKLGYEIVGVQKEIGYVQGQWKDIVIMQLILRD